MKIRGFEIAKGFENQEIQLPQRSTKHSAGYDVEAACDCVIEPFQLGMKPFLVETGIKAYMQEDEFLMLCNRSSNPFKKGLVMANSVGIIDADYYNNPDNEGEIFLQIYNLSPFNIQIKEGEAIGQGIILPYGVTEDDVVMGDRTGGFGSTNV